jgi:hypothetical protein
MQFGMMNNPRAPILTEIERAARMRFDFIDLTIEAPGAAPESTDWPAVRAALDDQRLRVVAHAAPYLPLNNPSPSCARRRWMSCAAVSTLRTCLTHLSARRTLSAGRSF